MPQPGQVWPSTVDGSGRPPWFQRSLADQAAATPGAQLRMLDGFDHNAPVEVIAPVLTGFFGASR